MSGRSPYSLVAAAVLAGCSSTSAPAAAPAQDAAVDASEEAQDAQPEASAPSGPVATASQLVVVLSKDWKAVPATVARYESASPGGPWSQVGASFAVELGHAGLGWGRGLHPTPPAADPVKHEGDGRAPAGVFELKLAFGYAPPSEASWIKLEYLQATSDLECVDDANSKYYNQVLYRSSLPTSGPDAPDWKSSEIMLRPDELYRWGLVVNHNPAPAVPGGGSCIFVHLWGGPSSPTVGCTAGAESNIKELIGWLDPDTKPLVVQLPQASYDTVKDAWGLP